MGMGKEVCTDEEPVSLTEFMSCVSSSGMSHFDSFVSVWAPVSASVKSVCARDATDVVVVLAAARKVLLPHCLAQSFLRAA
jgi:hypothetical protein